MGNVQDFGALGDGIADDTQAIQHAIDDGSGLLEFPRGEYRITRTLRVDLTKTSRKSIVGSGGTAKIQMHGRGPAFAFLASHAKTADPGGFRPEEWKNERMPMLADIEIEGHHAEADGVLIKGVMQPTLTGVLIREVRTAVHVTDRARNLLISHCHFYHNTGVGVHFENVNLHQAIISASHISYCRLGGIRIQDSEVRNLQITGNDIEYNNNRSHAIADADDVPTAEIYIDVGNGSVREGTISSNTIQAKYSPNGANIRFVGRGGDVNHKAGMWTITGNLIGSQNNNIHLSSVRDVTISGNTIYSGHNRNLLVEDSRNIVVGPNTFGHNPDYRKNELATGIRFENCVSCNISGLLIEDAEAGKHTVPNVVPIVRQGLIELVNCRRMNLSGTQILDGTPNGLFVDGCSDTIITGCTIVDDREPKQMERAVEWRNAGSGNMISTCRLGMGSAGRPNLPENIESNNNLFD